MTPYTTSTGLQIGRCYIPPAMPVQGDAVSIQTALLGKPASTSTLGDKVAGWTLTAAAIAVILSVCFGVPT